MSGPPDLTKSRRPSAQVTSPAYEPVKPEVTAGAAERTGLPAIRATSLRTASGSAVQVVAPT